VCGIYILLYEGELIEHINDLLTNSITDKARDMDFDEYRKFKGLYESMRKGEKTEVIHQYAMMSEEPSSSMTVCEDTVLHMAINMRHETTGGGFETLGGDKTHCFISRNKSLQTINTKA